MLGNLDQALAALLRDKLPALFGGAAPAVPLAVAAGAYTLDPRSTDPEAGQPRSDSALETLGFDPAHPAGPYRLAKLPDASVRVVRLTTAAGDSTPVGEAEVVFDPLDPRAFRLALRPGRDLAAVTGVRVLYGVTGVFAGLRYLQDLALTLTAADGATLARAEALAVGVLALNLAALVDAGAASQTEGDYTAAIALKALHLGGGDAPTADTRRILMKGEFELKAGRALGADEGHPIASIRAPGSTGTRPIDLRPDVEA